MVEVRIGDGELILDLCLKETFPQITEGLFISALPTRKCKIIHPERPYKSVTRRCAIIKLFEVVCVCVCRKVVLAEHDLFRSLLSLLVSMKGTHTHTSTVHHNNRHLVVTRMTKE